MLRLIALQQLFDPTTVIEAATNLIITALSSEFDSQLATKAENEVKYRLNVFQKQGNTKQGITDGLTAIVASIDVDAIYDADDALHRGIIVRRDLAQALKYFNRKNLASRMSSVFNLSRNEYPELVLRMLNLDRQADVVAVLLPSLPTLPNLLNQAA